MDRSIHTGGKTRTFCYAVMVADRLFARIASVPAHVIVAPHAHVTIHWPA